MIALKKVLVIVTTFLLLLSLFSYTSAIPTKYVVVGNIPPDATVWHSISSICQGDLVTINVSSKDGNISSTLFDSNLTIVGNYSLINSTMYQFIAKTSGNYLIMISPAIPDKPLEYSWETPVSPSGVFTYQITSSNPISDENKLTPYVYDHCEIPASSSYGTIFISDIKQGDLVLVSLYSFDYPIDIDLYYPNQSIAFYPTMEIIEPLRDDSFSAAYQFRAPFSGTYTMDVAEWYSQDTHFGLRSSKLCYDSVTGPPTPTASPLPILSSDNLINAVTFLAALFACCAGSLGAFKFFRQRRDRRIYREFEDEIDNICLIPKQEQFLIRCNDLTAKIENLQRNGKISNSNYKHLMRRIEKLMKRVFV